MPELKLENSLVDNRYEVRERLTRGSYAEIFVAYDRGFEREVVIKALNTSLQGTPDIELERTLIENFQNEAIALDLVRHEHVIQRLGHGTAADLTGVPFHYLVLEYMAGGDLLKLCRSKPGNALPISDALGYFEQACSALTFAHSQGIIHRDLKPNNFLLSADQKTLKIADFGVAKNLTDGAETEITRVGADVYAPPEHHPGEIFGQFNRVTAAADIYSLAKSFYTVVCGRAPNEFNCDPITYLPDAISDEPWGGNLLNVLRRATDDEPTDRYATVVEFWSELRQVRATGFESDEGDQILARPEADDYATQIISAPFIAEQFIAEQFIEGLPDKPVEPDFDLTLASTRARVNYNSATPVRPRELQYRDVASPARADHRQPAKFFVELKDRKPQPAPRPSPQSSPQPAPHQYSQPGSVQAPVAPRPSVRKPPAQVNQVAQRRSGSRRAAQRAAVKFTSPLRRRLFTALLAVAVLGSLLSVYNMFKQQAPPASISLHRPFGFGAPTEIEVTAIELNVRSGPSINDQPLGSIEHGSRHRVLAQTKQGWMQIQVSSWKVMQPETATNVGWINGSPAYVRVTARKLW